jgi:hypothetical protein
MANLYKKNILNLQLKNTPIINLIKNVLLLFLKNELLRMYDASIDRLGGSQLIRSSRNNSFLEFLSQLLESFR